MAQGRGCHLQQDSKGRDTDRSCSCVPSSATPPNCYSKYHQMDLWISMCAFTWCRLIALQTYIPGSCYTQNVSGIIFNNDLVIYFTYFLSCSCYIFYIFLVNDLVTGHFTYSFFFLIKGPCVMFFVYVYTCVYT